MKLLWQESAWEEYLQWQSQDKKSLRKMQILAILCWCQLTDTRFCILEGFLPY